MIEMTVVVANFFVAAPQFQHLRLVEVILAGTVFALMSFVIQRRRSAHVSLIV